MLSLHSSVFVWLLYVFVVGFRCCYFSQIYLFLLCSCSDRMVCRFESTLLRHLRSELLSLLSVDPHTLDIANDSFGRCRLLYFIFAVAFHIFAFEFFWCSFRVDSLCCWCCFVLCVDFFFHFRFQNVCVLFGRLIRIYLVSKINLSVFVSNNNLKQHIYYTIQCERLVRVNSYFFFGFYKWQD